MILFQPFLLPITQILIFRCRQNCLWCCTANKTSDLNQVKNNLLSTLKKEANSQMQEFLGLLLLPSLFYHGNMETQPWSWLYSCCTTFLPFKKKKQHTEEHFRNRNATYTIPPTGDNKTTTTKKLVLHSPECCPGLF